MAEERKLDFRFVASPEVIEDLKLELEKDAEVAEILGSGPVADATDLSFDLGLTAELIALISTSVSALETLFKALQGVFQKRPGPIRIRIESPLGVVEFEARREMTEEEVRAALRKLTEL